jgi:hypothetical protein
MSLSGATRRRGAHVRAEDGGCHRRGLTDAPAPNDMGAWYVTLSPRPLPAAAGGARGAGGRAPAEHGGGGAGRGGPPVHGGRAEEPRLSLSAATFALGAATFDRGAHPPMNVAADVAAPTSATPLRPRGRHTSFLAWTVRAQPDAASAAASRGGSVGEPHGDRTQPSRENPASVGLPAPGRGGAAMSSAAAGSGRGPCAGPVSSSIGGPAPVGGAGRLLRGLNTCLSRPVSQRRDGGR